LVTVPNYRSLIIGVRTAQPETKGAEEGARVSRSARLLKTRGPCSDAAGAPEKWCEGPGGATWPTVVGRLVVGADEARGKPKGRGRAWPEGADRYAGPARDRASSGVCSR
jgi:hypothetical protein